MNKNYIEYQKINNSSKISFYIQKNGKYNFKYFRNNNYMNFGKILNFEITEVDDLSFRYYDNGDVYLQIKIATWDPYLNKSW
jgi:hypothetical protein